MGVWRRETKARHVRYLRDRVGEMLPWTNPIVLTVGGYPRMRLDLMPVVSLFAFNAAGRWRIEVCPDFRTSGSRVARRVDLALGSDRDIDEVARQVVAVCAEEWGRTVSAKDASQVMREKAFENLGALQLHRPPASLRHPAAPRFRQTI